MFIALLRAVNVGGTTKVPMTELRQVLDELGLRDVRSLLQTGNLVFSNGAGTNAAELEWRLEGAIANRFGLRTDVMVRTAQEWRRIVVRNPFPDEAERDPSHLVVMCLKDAPNASHVRELQAAITGPELVRAGERELYITYPMGIGRSRLTNALIEARLATRGTARNWNTVLRLGELVAE
ncbi:MAG TPA: DUF1697 domain-containing protein [Candidatus Limnocylindria bacterium]|nr:DUF1697 domain-containing protein [Candidatus Limnocylindria bacterium]